MNTNRNEKSSEVEQVLCRSVINEMLVAAKKLIRMQIRIYVYRCVIQIRIYVYIQIRIYVYRYGS